jgi:hypothetical protein
LLSLKKQKTNKTKKYLPQTMVAAKENRRKVLGSGQVFIALPIGRSALTVGDGKIDNLFFSVLTFFFGLLSSLSTIPPPDFIS